MIKPFKSMLYLKIWTPFLQKTVIKICLISVQRIQNLKNRLVLLYLRLVFAIVSVINAIQENLGIHILNQDPWEVLCSFIISQNNNIPRIKSIIERLCRCYGTCHGKRKLKVLSGQVLACLRGLGMCNTWKKLQTEN